jgi:hypothetical protein
MTLQVDPEWLLDLDTNPEWLADVEIDDDSDADGDKDEDESEEEEEEEEEEDSIDMEYMPGSKQEGSRGMGVEGLGSIDPDDEMDEDDREFFRARGGWACSWVLWGVLCAEGRSACLDAARVRESTWCCHSQQNIKLTYARTLSLCHTHMQGCSRT